MPDNSDKLCDLLDEMIGSYVLVQTRNCGKDFTLGKFQGILSIQVPESYLRLLDNVGLKDLAKRIAAAVEEQ